MTRFNITMNQAIDLILRSLDSSIGGEVFVPKLSTYTLKDLIDAVFELTDVKKDIDIISVRPGEKYHESLIGADEIRNTYETDKDYVLIDKDIPFVNFTTFPNLEKTKLEKQYSSEKSTKLTKDEIKKIIKQEGLLLKK